MKFNQFSYIPTANDTIKEELALLGFNFQEESDPKKMLEAFVRQVSFQYKDTDYALSTLVADKETDLLAFFNSEKPLTADIFYTVAFQLLGFSFFVDFDDSEAFRKETAFPITYGSLLENLYQLLNTRTKRGNSLIDQLVSDGLIPETNQYHYFNGKSLATFTSHDAIREVVYVESRVDTDQDGLPDLVKVASSVLATKARFQLS